MESVVRNWNEEVMKWLAVGISLAMVGMAVGPYSVNIEIYLEFLFSIGIGAFGLLLLIFNKSRKTKIGGGLLYVSSTVVTTRLLLSNDDPISFMLAAITVLFICGVYMVKIKSIKK